MPKKITQNVNKDKLFNDLPKVHPEMSSWKTRHTNYQSCNLGQIVPIYYDEVLPNEYREVHLGMISHTTTPIAPIFNSLYTEIRSFFVPMRLAADLLNGYRTRKSPWVKVFGEDNANQNSNVIVPLANQVLPKMPQGFITSLTNYFNAVGNSDNVFDSLDIQGSVLAENNYLALASYELIYQRHYRNENYESATQSDLYRLLFDSYNRTASPAFSVNFRFEIANREKDYFTGAKPFTLKASSPINVGLAGEAKLKVSTSSPINLGGNAEFYNIQSGSTTTFNFNIDPQTGLYQDDSTKTVINGTNLVADLSTASGISIEELRMLIKTQELLEKDAIYGSLYAESLNAHFGCCPLDLTLQDPQELYKTTITSNMQAIFQTSSTSGEASILGTIGANSTTQTDPFIILPRTKFLEHGIIMICAVHKLQNVYNARKFIPKFNYKHERFDFYTPELNDLGYQPVTNREMISGSAPVVGFNEAFAEYRYKFNKSHGRLNFDFPYWAPAIGTEYSSIAALYKEGTVILDKALSDDSTVAPQFYDAWGFEEINTKPMSLHSIPGMDGVI